MQQPARHPKFTSHISLVVTMLRLGTDVHPLLCALITNYVYWMFLLVSSAHAMGCQEKKYREETS